MTTKRVIATARGYHGTLIEQGETFEVHEKVEGSWFQPVAEKKAATEEAKPETLRLPSKGSKDSGKDLV